MELYLKILIISILVIAMLSIIYSFYQLARNEAVYKIRVKWIWSNDERYPKYTYDEMLDPNKNNWYGLKYPKDESFT